MIFSAPILLYLLPLAGLPIVFHLILKQKKRTMVFSTLMFFHQVDPKLNTRRRIREWLLLLLRVLMIALVLLALSRPTLRSSVGTGGKLSLVAIIDNSGSMSAAADRGDLTKLECAKEGARRLLSSLEQGTDAALVLTVEDVAVGIPKTLTADRDELLQCLDRIAPTEATGDARRALSQAFEFLRGTAARGGVVHVFSDLQQVEWGENNKRFEAKDALVHTYLHRIGTSPQPRANVAVATVVLPEQRILIGQPYEVGLSLRNNSDATADVRINCVNDRGERSTQNLSLQKQQIATVRLPITMNEQGYHWLKTWVEGDAFAADNTAGIGLFCEGMGTVLFAGEPRQFGILPMALCPSGGGQLTGLVTRFAPAVQLGQKGVPVLVVTTWGGLTAAGPNPTELLKYIEDGGNLLVVPSLLPGLGTSANQAPVWLGASVRSREAYKSGVRLALLNRDAPFWRQMEQVVGDISAEPIIAYAFGPLDLPSGITPLLSAGAKKVVLAHKALGQGNLFLSGVAFSPRWTTLPLSGLGVVMAQRMAVCSVPVRASQETPDGTTTNGSHIVSLVAGERPQAWPAEHEMELLSLSGDALEWKGRAADMPAFPRTGVYLATTGNEKCCISVRAAPKEGEYRFVEGSHVPILASATHTVVPFTADEDYTQYHAGQARAAELYIPTLLLLTLVVFFEGLLGAAGVRRSRGENPVKRFLLGIASPLTRPASRLLLHGRRT
jgi:hypothetical protein